MSRKAPSKTALLRLAAQRASPYKRPCGGVHYATVPKGTKRRADDNDYSQKYQHGAMYIRDELNPQVHYRIAYTPALELWLLSQPLLPVTRPGGLDAPRYSSLRTTTHPTHRILGADVKTYHLLRDSGFRYKEKFPACIRLCLDGMGASGSSNRPYALCLEDFVRHFQTIAVAYSGVKKAKLCLYEQPAQRPRVEWLQQLTHLVFRHAPYDSTRYTVKYLEFDGTQLIEVANPVKSSSSSTVGLAPLPLSSPKQLVSPATSALLCHEDLSTSEDENDDDDTATVVHEGVEPYQPDFAAWRTPDVNAPMIDDFSASQETIAEEDEEQLNDAPPARTLASPTPMRQDTLLPPPLPLPFDATQLVTTPSRAFSSYPTTFGQLPVDFLASPLRYAPSASPVRDQPLGDATATTAERVDSLAFPWLSKVDSMALDATAFLRSTSCGAAQMLFAENSSSPLHPAVFGDFTFTTA